MESTLKIGSQSRGIHSVPVIKIVQPVNFVNPNPSDDIDDVRDQLIAEFLHTPCMANRNHFFRTDSHYDYPTENARVHITTISAVEEGQMFHTFKHAILDRLISYENLVQINILQNQIKDGVIPNGVIHKAPIDYDKFLKIKEFFNWVYEQPYNGDPVNTPIEVRK